MGRILAKRFSQFLLLLSVVQWQSLTAALVIKTSVENGITGVVWDEGWKGFGRFRTTVDDIGVYKRCTVIRRVALCNRLSGERGAGGLGWCLWECVMGRYEVEATSEVGMCKMMALMINLCSSATAAAKLCCLTATCAPVLAFQECSGKFYVSSDKWDRSWNDRLIDFLINRKIINWIFVGYRLMPGTGYFGLQGNFLTSYQVTIVIVK